MEEEVVYGLRNPSCYLSCASLPRSGALLPGMLVFQPLTKSLSEPRFSLPLSSWQDPNPNTQTMGISAFCPNTQVLVEKISNILTFSVVLRTNGETLAGQSKVSPTPRWKMGLC